MTYRVCAWCEDEYDMGESNKIGYITRTFPDDKDVWVYAEKMHTDKDPVVHYVCPIHYVKLRLKDKAS